MPKISYVIPVYNKQTFIAPCLKSLVNQTVKDIEIVVVDDCSTDDSVNIIEHFAKTDKRIKLYKLKKNMGRSYARNYGNKKAKANIIAVQDADDMSWEKRSEYILDFFKDKKKDVFYSSFIVSDIYGRPLGDICARKFDIDDVVKTGVTYMGHSTMAYRKRVLDKVKYTGGKISKLGLDDWKLQIDMFKAGFKFGFSVVNLVIYRQMSSSVTLIRNAMDVYKQKGKYLKGL